MLDKPLGLTSTQALGRTRRLMGAGKAGHAGTLDPLATGLLPLAFGEATKTVPYLQDADKDYRFTLRFGTATTTDDGEGAATATSDHRPSDEALAAALSAMIGPLDQVPPAFSALKVDGARAYDLARAGAAVDLAPRRVTLLAARILDRPDADQAEIAITCSKGFYVRALARDLARAAGTVGHVAALRRTRIGPVTEDRLVTLDALEALEYERRLATRLEPVATALDDIPALAVGADEADRFRNGGALPLARLAPGRAASAFSDGGLARVEAGGVLVALAAVSEGLVRPLRVFHLQPERGDTPDVDHA